MLDRIARRVPKPLRKAVTSRLYPPVLDEGETAPEWRLRSWDGTWHTQEHHWSLLVFYPLDGSPDCTAQLKSCQAQLPVFHKLGCKVFGVNPGSASSHRAFAEREGLEFPLLVDSQGGTAAAWSCLAPLPGIRRVIRTVYLVNPVRKIRLANRGAPSVSAIVRSIQALQQATRSGM